MTIELEMLAASVVLGMLHLIAASHFISFQYGYRWTASNREQDMPPLKGAAGRIDRAYTNFLETFPLFVAAILIAHLAGKHNTLTAVGAQMYFWARVVYALTYAAGYPMIRSMVWNFGIGGITLLLIAAFLR